MIARSGLKQGCGALALALLLQNQCYAAAIPCTQTQTCTPTGASRTQPSRTLPPVQPYGGGGTDIGAIIGILVGIAAIYLIADGVTGKDWASSEDLDRDGPRFPNRQLLGNFQVQGYAESGWPVVVDLDTPPGSISWLEVRSRRMQRPVQLDLPGVGRRTRVVYLPNDGSFRPGTVARYTLRSAAQRPDGRPGDATSVDVYGIGAGPQAVGSITTSFGRADSPEAARLTRALYWPDGGAFASASIGRYLTPSVARPRADRVLVQYGADQQTGGSMTISINRFDPPEAASPAQVSYSLVSQQRYDRSILEVIRIPDSGDSLQFVKRASSFPLTPGRHDGSWAQLQVNPRPAAGTYAMQVRAWLVAANGDQHDWTGAYGPNLVTIP